MTSTTIKNGKIFYSNQIIEAELLIDDGKIKRIAKNIKGDRTINAQGQLILPGAIDVHVHFRDFDEAYKEDWYTGSCSAAAGGITTVVDQPNSVVPTCTPMSYKSKQMAAKKSIIDFGINGALESLEQANSLWQCGIIAFGEVFVQNKTRIEQANLLQIAKRINALVSIHAEKPYDSTLSEVEAIRDIIQLNKKIDAQLHIAHLSTLDGLKLVNNALQNITCEVTPHHLFLSALDSHRLGPLGIMNPPLRNKADADGLWSNIGKVDIIASDHAPHSLSDKKLPVPPPGVPGVETLVPLLLSNLSRIGLRLFARLTSTNPAKRFNLKNKGEIREGNDADLFFVNLRDKRAIASEQLHTKANWTPFEGMLGTFPSLTMLRGNVIFDGDILVEQGYGHQIFGPGVIQHHADNQQHLTS